MHDLSFSNCSFKIMRSDCYDHRKSARLASRKYKFPKVAAPFRERERIQLTARKWPRRYTKITQKSFRIDNIFASKRQDLRAYQGVHVLVPRRNVYASPYRYILISGDVPAAFDRSSSTLPSAPSRSRKDTERVGIIVVRAVAGSSPFLASFECCWPAIGRSFYPRNVEYSIRTVKWVELEIFSWLLCISFCGSFCDFLQNGGISGEIRRIND